MVECWNELPEQRPKFSKLHRIFDSYLSKNTQESYPYIELVAKSYEFDNLESAKPDQAPVNLDIEVTDVNGATSSSLPNSHGINGSASNHLPKLELATRAPNTTTNRLSVAQFTPPHLQHASLAPRQSLQMEHLRQLYLDTEDRRTGGEEMEMVDTRYVGFLPGYGSSNNVSQDEENGDLRPSSRRSSGSRSRSPRRSSEQADRVIANVDAVRSAQRTSAFGQ